MDTTLTPPRQAPHEADLHTGDARMDQTHDEFLAMLDEMRATDAAAQLPLFEHLIAHTEAHFAQEERWLQAVGFAAQNCHAMQHGAVLNTLREVQQRARQGDLALIAHMVDALAEWFPQHAASMDAGLALHMREAGYDSAREAFSGERAFTPANPGGCGSLGCS